jgi:hypothetical protein
MRFYKAFRGGTFIAAAIVGVTSITLRVEAQSSEHSKGPAVGVGVGTLGLLGEASFKQSPTFVWRLNAGGFSVDRDQSEGDNEYSGKARLIGAGAIADWHPFANGFRMSAGVRYHDLKVTGDAAAGDITLNGRVYQQADYGALTLRYSNGNKVAPYLGIGWDSAHYLQGPLSLGFELGALYTGKPNLSLSATRAAVVPGLQTDIDAEVADIKQAVDKFGGFWPVIALSLKYRF